MAKAGGQASRPGILGQVAGACPAGISDPEHRQLAELRLPYQFSISVSSSAWSASCWPYCGYREPSTYQFGISVRGGALSASS